MWCRVHVIIFIFVSCRDSEYGIDDCALLAEISVSHLSYRCKNSINFSKRVGHRTGTTKRSCRHNSIYTSCRNFLQGTSISDNKFLENYV